jgi:hypothetical protein
MRTTRTLTSIVITQEQNYMTSNDLLQITDTTRIFSQFLWKIFMTHSLPNHSRQCCLNGLLSTQNIVNVNRCHSRTRTSLFNFQVDSFLKIPPVYGGFANTAGKPWFTGVTAYDLRFWLIFDIPISG